MAASELQLSLLALGAAAIGGVLAYNAWQARRHRRMAEKLTARDTDDVLLGRVATPSGEPADAADEPVELPAALEAEMPGRAAGGERREPTIGSMPVADPVVATSSTAPAVAATGVERPYAPLAGTVAVPVDAAVAEPMPPVAAQAGSAGGEAASDDNGDGDPYPLPAHFLSYAVDYIAAFETMEAVPGDQIIQSQGEALRAIGKRVAWVGFDDATPAWEYCRGDRLYRRLRVGVQLADRRGPLDDSGLDSFYGAMQGLADELTAVADLPPRRAALETAQRLDRICAGVDIQVGVNVMSKGTPFAGTKIRALAEAAGMVIESDGTYVRRDDDGRLLYTLQSHDGSGFTAESMRSLSVGGLTFVLDVPRVANGDRVFNQMVEVARRFAETLQGALVDDNRRPITEQFLMPIRKQIAQYQATMAAQGLPAGSDVTLRLFA